MLLTNAPNNNRSASNRSNGRLTHTSKFVSAIGPDLKKTTIPSNLHPMDSSQNQKLFASIPASELCTDSIKISDNKTRNM